MKKILFYDCEAVARPVSSGCRPCGQTWDATQVAEAEKAVGLFDGGGFDAIVVGVRGGEGSGLWLLRRVREAFPETVRIALTDASTGHLRGAALEVSHHVLSTDVAPEALCEALVRAFDVRRFLGSQLLRAIVGRIETLPSVPSVYVELLRLAADPNATTDDVGRVVEQDVALAAKTLQLVNSSFFGLPTEVTSVSQATGLLGLETIKSLALSTSVFQSMQGRSFPHGFSLKEEQWHAMLCGRIARHVAPVEMRDGAVLASMLHDVGKIVLAAGFPSFYERSASLRKTGESIYRAEEETSTKSHADVGAYLLGLWGLPYDIVEGVALHHHPARVSSRHFTITGVVHVVDALANEATGTIVEGLLEFDYLKSVGMLDELPRWREMAAREAEVHLTEA